MVLKFNSKRITHINHSVATQNSNILPNNKTKKTMIHYIVFYLTYDRPKKSE